MRKDNGRSRRPDTFEYAAVIICVMYTLYNLASGGSMLCFHNYAFSSWYQPDTMAPYIPQVLARSAVQLPIQGGQDEFDLATAVPRSKRLRLDSTESALRATKTYFYDLRRASPEHLRGRCLPRVRAIYYRRLFGRLFRASHSA